MGQISSAIAAGCAVSLMTSFAARAEDVGTRLSKEEMASLLPSTKAEYVIKAGSIHRWTNEPDGKFVASTDAKTVSMSARSRGTARGTWKISDEGKYCINIDWTNVTEDWCQFLFRTDDGKYYLTGTDSPTAERHKIELTR